SVLTSTGPDSTFTSASAVNVKLLPPEFVICSVRVVAVFVSRFCVIEVGVTEYDGAGTPAPTTAIGSDGLSGSLLATVRVAFSVAGAVGWNVTVTVCATAGASVNADGEAVTVGSLLVIPETTRSSVPGLEITTVLVGEAPTNTEPKSREVGLAAMSGAPITWSEAGRETSPSSGSWRSTSTAPEKSPPFSPRALNRTWRFMPCPARMRPDVGVTV